MPRGRREGKVEKVWQCPMPECASTNCANLKPMLGHGIRRKRTRCSYDALPVQLPPGAHEADLVCSAFYLVACSLLPCVCVCVCSALGDQATAAAGAGTSGSNICTYENANCIAWQSPIRRRVASFASVSASAKCVTAVT